MPIFTQVQVRQPAKQDLVGRRFVVAGVGAGFEGTIGLRVLDSRGRELATGSARAAGGWPATGSSAPPWRWPRLHAMAPG